MNRFSKAYSPETVIVVVNWQRPADTRLCIESILAQGYSGVQVVIVDNGSQDGSYNFLKQAFLEYKEILIHLLALPNNLGFAGGYNFGISHARSIGAQNIVILNNDTIIDAQTIPALVNSPWDVAIPKIMYFDTPNKIWSAGSRLRKFPPAVVMIGHDRYDHPKYNQPRRLHYATGCAMRIRSHVLNLVPGFDPLYGNYMEDYDFTHRLMLAGLSLGYVPESTVWHKVSQTLGLRSPEFWNYMGRNAVIFYGRHFSMHTARSHVLWVFMRTFLQGRFKALKPYCQGVQAGFKVLAEINPHTRGV